MNRAGRDAALAWIVVAVLVAVAVRIKVTLPGIGSVGSAVVALLFLYMPMLVGKWRGEDLVEYGFVAAPIGRGLVTAGVAMLVIFPVFALGYFFFYDLACHSAWLSHFAPPGMCARYSGVAGLHLPHLDGKFFEFCAVQFIVVALPEELFFRGFLLKLLEKRFPPKRRLLGGGVGWALILSAAAFALVHLPKDGDPRALATFFPGLLFGWMRSRTGSILASTTAHAGSNILINLLDLAVLR